ncbi:MAG: ABC-F family ATP-binding cassette domain-containing protein [Anaerolineae bacterium]|nr:ABC-F family ATP-binding cassette domain-containing protein [Anaerolineae bacterium]
MSLITAHDLTKSFGARDIFSGISLSIPYHARIAIIGPNGIGKTTLLRILAQEEEPSKGVVSQARGLSIGHLAQEAGLESSHTLWEESLIPFQGLGEQETELQRLEQAMADPDAAVRLLEKYGRLQVEFEHQGGYTYIHRIQQVLSGLGFRPDEYQSPLSRLSGGERTRALLARLLLSEPDLLILDEPTNHLDIAAVEWLEGYLRQWEGATLIVSHDRYFLDQVVDTIWEMTRSGFEIYHGNYSAYVMQRSERWERRRELFESEKERLDKDLDYIKKNISGQNVTQARGRLRRLTRRIQAIEQVGLEATLNTKWGELSSSVDTTTSMLSPEEAERHIRSLREPANRPPQLHLHLHTSERSGDIVLRTYDLQIGYPGKTLFYAGDIELRRQQCTALIGPNGAGKPTFLKTILEKVPPVAGEVELGSSLKVGYFAQAHEDLHPELTLVEEIDLVAPKMLLADIRDYLAKFLFTGEDVFKQVEVLSGGERGRLALAKLALSGANLLLLDEPTNHLDIPSQEVLQEVLDAFQGTILLVSHDRYLIDALATQIWEIDEAKGILRTFKGSYSQYHLQLEAERLAQQAAKENAPATRDVERKPSSSGDERRRKKRLAEVEGRIDQLENDLADLGRKLENPPRDAAKVQKMGNEYVRLQQELDTLMNEWGELHG